MLDVLVGFLYYNGPSCITPNNALVTLERHFYFSSQLCTSTNQIDADAKAIAGIIANLRSVPSLPGGVELGRVMENAASMIKWFKITGKAEGGKLDIADKIRAIFTFLAEGMVSVFKGKGAA